ncbi:hypothetical protein RvY_10864 [Ramazzottius varieornatus]|uniref:G-protein coupled receptors family 1 profile domain-containing protein n=1 Tax=Ramazzottius varieornatus TaxID=947166 RepID=A0A1D1VE72_RAMVA|nr:hypothetical protein RvY_10864 [Ramazzottius varieornatus]
MSNLNASLGTVLIHSSSPANVTANLTYNRTTAEHAGSWTLGPSLTLFTILAGTLFNISLLTLFAKRPTLRTPFGVYLMNLIIANTAMACLWEPITLIQFYYSSWTMGYGACVFRQFLAWIIEAAVNWSHFLIAVNRFWAVIFPVSYHHRHHTKFAFATCISAWLAINITIVPTILTIAKLTDPDKNGKRKCTLDTDPIGGWGPVSQLVVYDLPLVFIVALYPLIFYKSFIATRHRRRRIRAANEATMNATKPASDTIEIDGSMVKSTMASRKAPAVGCCGRPQHGSVSGFVTLTLTTLSAMTCLAPSEVYFTLLLVFDTELSAEYYATVKLMQSLTVIFDPILIVLANPELRTLFRRYITCGT